jgi:hypothetical protein
MNFRDPQIQIHSSTFLHFYTYYTYVYPLFQMIVMLFWNISTLVYLSFSFKSPSFIHWFICISCEVPSIADTELGISEQYLFFCHQTGMVGHWILRLHTFYIVMLFWNISTLVYLSFSFKSPSFILLMLSNRPPSSIVLAHRWSWDSLR